MLWLLVVGALFARGFALTVTATTKDHWDGGFNGEFCIPFGIDVTSWTATMTLSEPIDKLEIWLADVVSKSDNGKSFVLKNKPWDGEEHAGDQLCVQFIGHGSGNIHPTVTVTIGNLPNATIRPTTPQGPTTKFVLTSRRGGESQVTPAFAGTRAVAFAQVTAPGGGGSAQATLEVTNDWGNRFEAQFNFHITEDVEGFEVIIKSNLPITKLDLQHADVYKKSADGKVWIIVNKQDSMFWKKPTVNLRFFGNHETSGKVSATATLFNLGVDHNGYPRIRNTDGSKYNYDEVLYKSILFYEAQRSGKLPKSNRIPWRGDSALGDKGSGGEDLTGGWYDAGDHVKFNFPMAFSTTLLTWSLIQWKDAYSHSGQLHAMYDSIKWPLDYLLKCHTTANELYVQVGNGNADHNFWGRPEDMTMARPAFKITASSPGSDVAGETAAAMAAGSIAFKTQDPAYSAKLLTHAKQLYKFAMAHKGKYSASVGAAASFYPSTNNTDEHAWAGLWLYMATKDKTYLTEAVKYHQPGPSWGMSWDDKQAANQVLFYKLLKDDKYKADIEDTFQHYWFPGAKIHYTPKGLAWRLQWGSLRYASNMATVALMAAEAGLHAAEYRSWAMKQIHYALGDTGFSYVVGFGNKFPHSPHHRSSSCPFKPAPCGPFVMSSHAQNVHTLFGAMVGGPDNSDGYKDDRSNYVNNEVACDYNAGFQAAVAGLKSLYIRKLHPEQKS